MRRTNRTQYRKAVLRLLEQEVKLYHDTVKELDEAKEDVILAGQQFEEGMPRGSGVGDSTQRLALTLYNSQTIRHMEKVCKAIERAKDEWCSKDTVTRYEFLQLKFWDNSLTNEGIAQKLSVSPRLVYLWRDQFLEMVGQYMGWRV